MYILTGHGPVGVEKTRLDVFRFKDGILAEYGFHRIPRSQHFQHMLDRETHVADDWFGVIILDVPTMI